MKIGNKTPARVTRTLTLDKEGGEKLTVTISALPLGYEEKVHAWMPFPRPKKKWATGRGGIPVFDKSGQPVAEDDVLDPEFQARSKRVVILQGVAYIYEALKADKEVTFSTPRPEKPDETGAMETFYAGIHAELIEANLTTGDYNALLQAVREISLDRTKVFQDIRESF